MKYKFTIQRGPEIEFDLYFHVSDGFAAWTERVPDRPGAFCLGRRKMYRDIYRRCFNRLYPLRNLDLFDGLP